VCKSFTPPSSRQHSAQCQCQKLPTPALLEKFGVCPFLIDSNATRVRAITTYASRKAFSRENPRLWQRKSSPSQREMETTTRVRCCCYSYSQSKPMLFRLSPSCGQSPRPRVENVREPKPIANVYVFSLSRRRCGAPSLSG
jgi:hypothetical protein